MGPSWYWMPDVFDRYFAQFGRTVDELYDLVRLDPSYRVEFAQGPFDVPAGTEALAEAFEAIEPGAGKKLHDFLAEAKARRLSSIDEQVASVLGGQEELDTEQRKQFETLSGRFDKLERLVRVGPARRLDDYQVERVAAVAAQVLLVTWLG